MRILYNIASRQRPEKCFELIDNINELSDSADYLILLKIDKDDPTIDRYFTNDDGTFGTDLRKVNVIVGEGKSKIDAINRDIPQDGWDILVNVSDDQKFLVKGFDTFINAAFKDGFKGFVHYPEKYKKAACSVMSIMHRDYYLSRGQIYSPAYYSLWCDTEATEVAKLLDQYRYIDLGFYIHEHMHHTAGYPTRDDLYNRNNTYKKDMKVYMERRARNFDLGFPAGPYILIKYATRGRWKEFFNAIDNIYATIKTNQYKILVSADFDDDVMNSDEVREFCRRYHNVELLFGHHQSKVEAINAHFNPNTQWKWCVNMSDDMKFIVPGWDDKMLKDVRTVWTDENDWDWFAHFNDGYVGDKLPTLNVCGRKWYDRTQYIYYPGYKSVSCDAENMYVAMMKGRYHYFPNVYFHHIHPANLREPSDGIYRRNHKHGEADTKLYFERLARMFDVEDPVMIPEAMQPYLKIINR